MAKTYTERRGSKLYKRGRLFDEKQKLSKQVEGTIKRPKIKKPKKPRVQGARSK